MTHDHYSFFGEAWWLDAVCGVGGWDEVRVENGGRLEARLPFVHRRRRGFPAIGMPPLTQTLGPWFAPAPGKPAQQLARQKDLSDALIGGLPAHDVFKQNFHPAVTNWLPWHWHGFSQTTRYSYALDRLDDLDAVWSAMQSNIRGDVRKAETRYALRIRDDMGVDALLDVCRKTNARQGRDGPPEHAVRRAVDAALARGAGSVLTAVDAKGRVHAGMFVVWDERAAYYLLGGGDPALRGSGAHSFVVWEAIRRAATVTSLFDFEGSMVESIERFFRAFGAFQRPYSTVSRVTGRLPRVANHLGLAWRALWSRPC